MSANYVLLETATVSATTAGAVTFNNIPQTGYTDLVIKASARGTFVGANWIAVLLTFNGTGLTDYNEKLLYGTGSSAGSEQYSGSPNGASTFFATTNSCTANTFGNAEIYIPNYANTTTAKTVSVDGVTETNATDALAQLNTMLWNPTVKAAITSITLTPRTDAFAANSTFSLYGVAAVGSTPAIAPKATGGDIIQTDGTYWYHAFLSSGTFTPAVGLSCDVLQVAGGGGGGGTYYSGGGGAGGISYLTTQSIAASAQTVTIGAGGAGGPTDPSKGTSGSNSQFASLTAAVGGGGGGGGGSQKVPLSGGSGGGGATAGGTAATGASGVSGQGSNGGDGYGIYAVVDAGGGGGGGAGGVGGNAARYNGGNGGAGTNTYSTWLNATGTGISGYIAGGGAGGTDQSSTVASGGSGGGGNGGSVGNNPVAGKANAGSGGGAGGNNQSGASGGSGIIILRYAV